MNDEKLGKRWLLLMLAVNPGCALIILNVLFLFIEGEFMSATGILAVVLFGSVFSVAFFIAVNISEKEKTEREDRIEGLKKSIDAMHDLSDNDKEQIINAIGYWLRVRIKRKEEGEKGI